ncbi:hypothetical protein [Ruegeria arenilitoris]|uniref:hypothetical protein n=1 Tax=Ruegeria arenilitoris TaxID=1173585 RepID=UPI00147DFC9D|nr:hypothetical protein [Ruegeria arenilitoris]
MSEKRQMKFSATACVALVTGTASADISCEGPEIKLVEQGGKALISLFDGAINETGNCGAFRNDFTEGEFIPNLRVCTFIDTAITDKYLNMLVLEPHRILWIPIKSGESTSFPYGIPMEATCTGLEDE